MRHYGHLTRDEQLKTFYQLPTEFDKFTPKETLSLALGATMYTPLTKTDIAKTLIERKYPALTTNVLCLEDAVGDGEVEEAEENLFVQMKLLSKAIVEGEISTKQIPLLFVRVRQPEQLQRLLARADELDLLTGFSLPKFTFGEGTEYLALIERVYSKFGKFFYAMPILETPDVLYLESRKKHLQQIRGLLDAYKDFILNVRLGGTDFSSLYGIRRGVDFTIYDIQVIRDTIADVMNLFGRSDDQYVVSGCVWEYFSDHRLLKPQLRVSPFSQRKGHDGEEERRDLIVKEIDGLIREVLLDKANGITGKTIIHPSHIKYVNALQAVTYEEYHDALAIVGNQDKGVLKSGTGNKMNEIKPHSNWAQRVLKKAEIYGVLSDDADYIDLF